MGKRDLDQLLLDWIIKTGRDEVTFVGANDRTFLTNRVSGLGIEIRNLDSDPKFSDPIDAVFDRVDFDPLVVVFNAEKHYPLGKKISREMIIVGDNDQHNGDCNPIEGPWVLIEQNNFQTLKGAETIDKWHVAWGDTRAES